MSERWLSSSPQSIAPGAWVSMRGLARVPAEAPGREGGLVPPRTLADADDAAGLDRVEPELARARDDRRAVGAGIQPDLRDLFSRELVHHADPDFGRYVDRRHIDRTRHVEHGGIGAMSFHLPLVGIDGNDRVALVLEGAERLVAEFVPVAGRADDRDSLGQGFDDSAVRGSGLGTRGSGRGIPC